MIPMRKQRSFAALPVAVAFLFVAVAPAIGQSALGQEQTVEVLLLRDSRLAAPVTLSIKAQPVRNVLPQPRDLPLGTTRSAAWTRVTVFTHKQPLRDVLLGMSELLNHEWTNDGEDNSAAASTLRRPTRYVLTQSRRARSYEDRLYLDALNRGAEPLFKLANYTQTLPEEWAKRKDALGQKLPDDPLLRPYNGANLVGLTYPNVHAGLALLRTLSPRQRVELLDQEQLFLPYAAMTPQQQELARSVLTSRPSRHDDNLELLPEEAVRARVDRNLSWLERFGLVLSVHRSPTTGALTGYRVGGAGGVGGAAFEDRPLVSPLPVRGRPYPQREQDSNGAVISGGDTPSAPPATGYADSEKVPFPAKIAPNPARDTWSAVLEQLAEHVSLPLFSDDFIGTREGVHLFPAPSPNLAGLSLAQGLDALCAAYGRLWWRDAKGLYFRSSTWFVEQRYEVPPPVLAALSKQVEATPPRLSAVLDTLGTLTLQQLHGLSGAAVFEHGQRQSPVGSRLREARQTRDAFQSLRFYRTLSVAQQRRGVVSPDGLTFAQMTGSQQQAFLVLAFVQGTLDRIQNPTTLHFVAEAGKPLPDRRADAPWVLPILLYLRQGGQKGSQAMGGSSLWVPHLPGRGEVEEAADEAAEQQSGATSQH